MRTTTKIVFLLAMGTIVSSCKLGRFVYYNTADITDYKIFPYRTINKSTSPFVFTNADKVKVPRTYVPVDKEVNFENYLKENKTVAFLIIQNDSIKYENYWNNYDKSSPVASFSMAKSVLSILMGIAIDDKLIQSVQEPITNYIPELKKNGFEKVTIEHVLQMTTGLDFNESYINPFGHAATFYYGTNLSKATNKLKLKNEPGTTFEYVSGNSQLLALVLERALKDKTVSAYLQEKLWQPLGMEYDATWSLDRKENGIEKGFCCLNATARDFAKLGRLYLNKGNWNGKQIVSENWVEQSTKIDTTNGSVPVYQYQWWLPSANEDFMAEGILGQFVFVKPSKNLIIVRLGERKGKADWWKLLTILGEAY